MRIALFALAAGLATPAFAATVEDEQAWINLTAMGGTKMIWFAEAQPRLSPRRGPQQILLRGALGWQATKRLGLYGGYAHIALPSETGPDRHETRLFTQASLSLGTVGGGALSSRTRIEHRRHSAGDDTAWRARQLIRWSRPISGDPRVPKALVHYEGFVAFNRTDWGTRPDFDQGRAFAGFDIPLIGRTSMDLGYLNQHITTGHGNWRVNHVASMILWARL